MRKIVKIARISLNILMPISRKDLNLSHPLRTSENVIEQLYLISYPGSSVMFRTQEPSAINTCYLLLVTSKPVCVYNSTELQHSSILFNSQDTEATT